MTSLTSIAARRLLLKATCRNLKKEIEQAGIENLKTLVEAGVSIVGTYLNGFSPREKAQKRRELQNVLSMGITNDMIIDELTRQITELGPIMAGREAYRKAELAKIDEFLK